MLLLTPWPRNDVLRRVTVSVRDDELARVTFNEWKLRAMHTLLCIFVYPWFSS